MIVRPPSQFEQMILVIIAGNRGKISSTIKFEPLLHRYMTFTDRLGHWVIRVVSRALTGGYPSRNISLDG